MYKHLLIATDGSELADKAVEHGIALAKELAARLTVVTVTEAWAGAVSGEMAIGFPREDYDKAVATHAAEVLEHASAAASKAGIACAKLHVRNQHPADGIVHAARTHGCDLIVMASHGRRGISRLLLGSQANKVVVHSPVPVLVCR
jgi:nucleotide-binding universal stress UspA family protein